MKALKKMKKWMEEKQKAEETKQKEKKVLYKLGPFIVMGTEEEKITMKAGIIAVIGIFIIIIFDFILIENFLRDMLNLKPGAMSLFTGTRILLALFYVICFLPGALIGEFAISWVKKRSFKPRNVLIFLVFFGEVVLVAAVLSTLFDVFLSEASPLIQVPLVAVSISISSLVVAFTLRVKRINNYVKKAFD